MVLLVLHAKGGVSSSTIILHKVILSAMLHQQTAHVIVGIQYRKMNGSDTTLMDRAVVVDGRGGDRQTGEKHGINKVIVVRNQTVADLRRPPPPHPRHQHQTQAYIHSRTRRGIKADNNNYYQQPLIHRNPAGLCFYLLQKHAPPPPPPASSLLPPPL